MTHSTPIATFLAERLAELGEARLEEVCSIAGATHKVAKRAIAIEPIAASDALKLFAALGYDPMTRKVRPSQSIGALDLECLALFLVAAMSRQNQYLRQAAGVMGVSTRALTEARDCRPVNLANTLRICAYVGVHPFDQCGKAERIAA